MTKSFNGVIVLDRHIIPPRFGSPLLAARASRTHSLLVKHVFLWQEQRGLQCPRYPCPSPPALAPLQHARHRHGCCFTTTSLPLLSLAEDSSPAGMLPAPSAKVEDNNMLCALTVESCQMVADGIFPPDPVAVALQLASRKDHPSLGVFLLPPPCWHTADCLTRLSHFP